MSKDGRVGRAGNAVSAFLPGLHPGSDYRTAIVLILSTALILHGA